MSLENMPNRDRAKLAVLERIERPIRHITDAVSIVCGVASTVYLGWLCCFLVGLISVGAVAEFAVAVASGIVMLMFAPALFILETIEKRLSSQISEASRPT